MPKTWCSGGNGPNWYYFQRERFFAETFVFGITFSDRVGFTLFGSNTNLGHFPPNTRFLALLSPTRSVFGCLAGWFFLFGWLAGWLVVFGVSFGWLPWLAGWL